MLTNTYTPHVGGVARSVECFAQEYRRLGHQVLVVAPEFPDQPEGEEHVVRVPAIQQFNGSDFSVRLPAPGILSKAVRDFEPDIIHAHHPFLLGDTAQRLASSLDLPLVFTHHTMWERYTHYVPGDSPVLQRFTKELATHYANLCDLVFAPSESIARVLRSRGVEVPIEVVPTGVDVERFAQGDSQRVREKYQLPEKAFVVGHVGRLAPEKNLPLLTRGIAMFMRGNRNAYFLLVGRGPSEDEIEQILRRYRVHDRLRKVGTLQGKELIDAYAAMDVFAFASTSETQGIVLVEAMAAGNPVVAVDAPGAREVVIDGKNGRLLPREDPRSLARALQWVAQHKEPSQLRENARNRAAEFSTQRCAETALEAYHHLSGRHQGVALADDGTEDSTWEGMLRLIEREYHLWESRANAVVTAVQGEFLLKMPFVRWVLHYRRRLWRALSRNEWTVKLLNLSTSRGTQVAPGLIMIQIDGLSRAQFEHALHRRRMPFLARMLSREGYRTTTFYSGLPSSTPAVQGELFYGTRCAVPSFSFRDSATGLSVRMFDQPVAAGVEQRLEAAGVGLLDEGSSYSNIYSGGAKESHLCASRLGWGYFLRTANPFSLAIFAVLHLPAVLHIALLCVGECFLAIYSFLRGVATGLEFAKELQFIPTRLAVCVLLREIVTLNACIDATRGLPIVHLNLLGYDEHSHRRGPSSGFAHWTLPGIDKAIRRIWNVANNSQNRDYSVWIYSDHGQEDVVPYPHLTGKSIDQSVNEVLTQLAQQRSGENRSHSLSHKTHKRPPSSSVRKGEGWLARLTFKLLRSDSRDVIAQSEAVVTAAGPIGHIYLSDQDKPLRGELAERLARDAHVPAVLALEGDQLVAWTVEGKLQLPRDAERLFGPSHPFFPEVYADLEQLCRHPDSGDLVLSGWRAGQRPVSFPVERGAHAGYGNEETRGFALLPTEVATKLKGEYLRPAELRRLAIDSLNPPAPLSRPSLRVVPAEAAPPSPSPAPLAGRSLATRPLRVLTYNIHSCIGLDGKLSPARIARVVARTQPDIVALQEVDVGRRPTWGADQAHQIAQQLSMEHHFHPSWQVEEERYGNAVLSCLPLRLIKAGGLPGDRRKPGEPRGALWVEIDLGGRQIHLINTHLGLSARERELQIETLLGSDWLGGIDPSEPVILCGDFNMPARCPGYEAICRQLRDSQLLLPGHRPKATWSSTYPWRRLDYIFLSAHFESLRIDVTRSQLTQVASDHLPLLTELRIAAPALLPPPATEADIRESL